MNAEITDKISALFELRRIPWLLRLTNCSDEERQSYYQRLISLQFHIYGLDKYLEQTWDPDPDILNQLWESCIDQLSLLEIKHEEARALLHSFHIYLQRELAIRKGKTPELLTIRSFYWHKSCDVKLMRTLIYDRFSAITKEIPRQAWIAFDYLTEIVDDLEDLEEDTHIINGNRLLFALRNRPISQVRQEYLDFTTWIEQRSKPDRKNWPARMIDEFEEHLFQVRRALKQVILPGQ